jgi:transglutaminase-like putative cysteine protease
MFPELELKEGWATVALLLIILFCVAWSLQTANWTDGLAILQAIVLVAGLMGIVLAKSRFPSITAHLLSLLAALTWTAYLASRVLASASDLPMEAAVVELDRQIVAWFSVLLSGGTSAGNYVFLVLLGLLLWLVAYFSAWAIFRWQRVWWAVIVCGVALMLNITYAPKNLTGYLIAFVLFALLLVVRTSLAFYQQEWRLAKVGYSPELVYAFLRAGLTITVVAILLAWVAPAALASRPMQDVWDTLGKPWEQLKEESNRLFQDLNYQKEPAFILFSRSMKFGGAVNLPDTPLMDVEANWGRYWRVMVYHEYTGTGWTNTDYNTILIEENEPRLETPSFAFRREVTQTITLHQDLGPQGIIAAAGQPLRSALPLSAVVSYVAPEEDQAGEPDPAPASPVPSDPSALYSRLALREGDAYEVISSLTRVDEESLQQAGTDYPDWIAPRYLQLPDSVPERVTDLAHEITTTYDNPFDRAKAVEQFLREIPYNEQIAGPGPEQDGVDYFLFDAQEGYCEYYASAMVVMLRELGVPARYVEGYSQGRKEDGAYHILESDGHAWPEVFFPGYGWVEFEPTGGEPALIRPRSQNVAGGNQNNPVRPNDLRDERMEAMYENEGAGLPSASMQASLLQRVTRWAGVALVVVGLGMLLAALLVYRRRRRIEGLNVAERVYQDMVSWVGRLLRTFPLAHQTPHEYGASVVSVLPAGRQPVGRIVDTYVGYRFGGRIANGKQVEGAWRDTQKALWRRWLEQKAKAILVLPRRRVPPASERPDWQESPPKRS